jgi:hypothetical protein
LEAIENQLTKSIEKNKVYINTLVSEKQRAIKRNHDDENKELDQWIREEDENRYLKKKKKRINL